MGGRVVKEKVQRAYIFCLTEDMVLCKSGSATGRVCRMMVHCERHAYRSTAWHLLPSRRPDMMIDGGAS